MRRARNGENLEGVNIPKARVEVWELLHVDSGMYRESSMQTDTHTHTPTHTHTHT